MNAEQAMQLLMNALVTKPGLSVQDCAAEME
jgi:hypothetical protein